MPFVHCRVVMIVGLLDDVLESPFGAFKKTLSVVDVYGPVLLG